MICEREREILAFIPEVYYEIFADLFPTKTTDVFRAKYAKAVKDEKTAKAIVAGVKGKPITIADINKKQINSKPPAPFITKTLLASASTILGWKAAKTTNVAQSLFQGGHITYIRCDNPVISTEGQTLLLKYVNSNYSKEYHAKSIPDYADPKAKLEHECIRPTQLDALPSLVNGDEKKLYELIRKRFLASALPPAVYDSVSVDLTLGAHPFKASGSTLVFEGYLKEWDYSVKSDTTLPELTKATPLSLRDVYEEKKETKPPARYKDASLIDALEKKGIGKPSTFKSILDILDQRGYIKYDKQSLIPTELGLRLHDFLSKYFLKIIDYDFTARIEQEQEEVEAGKLTYETAVAAFYKNLNEELKHAQVKIASDREVDEKTTHICPTCKEQVLLKKINRKEGKHFYSCAGYLDKSCAATFAIGEDGLPTKVEAKLEVLSDCPGTGCTGKLVKRINKKTKQVFYACTAWASGCKVTADESGTVKAPAVVKKTGKKCSKCGKGEMVERVSKAGNKFAACNRFPSCRNTESME
jgi:DNA topoisomerase-1